MWWLVSAAMAYCTDPLDAVVWDGDTAVRLRFGEPAPDPWWDQAPIPGSNGQVWRGTLRAEPSMRTRLPDPRVARALGREPILVRGTSHPTRARDLATTPWDAPPPRAVFAEPTVDAGTCTPCTCAVGVALHLEGDPHPPAYQLTLSTEPTFAPEQTWRVWTDTLVLGEPPCRSPTLDWDRVETVWVRVQIANIHGELGPASDALRVVRPTGTRPEP